MRKVFQIASLVLIGAVLFSVSSASATQVGPKRLVKTFDPTACTAICGTPVTTDVTNNLTIRGAIDPCAPRSRGKLQDALKTPAAVDEAPIKNHVETGDGETPAPKIIGGRAAVICGGKAQLTDCASPLGHLPDVSEREVRSVDLRDRVKLIPICDRMDASLTQAQQYLTAHGNADSLVPVIAQNVVLRAALGHARYKADDVVGIKMGTHSVLLYVHKM